MNRHVTGSPASYKEFTEQAGQILARALGDDSHQIDYIARLTRAYERLVDDLPSIEEDAH